MARLRVQARGSRDAGETLVEVVITVAILGIAVAAILGGLGTSILTSTIHREQATVETVLRSYAEAVQNATYVPCPSAGPTAYVTSSVTVPASFNPITSVPVKAVPSNPPFTGTFAACGAGAADTGSEQVTIQASSKDGRVSEQVQIIKRAP